MKADIIGKETDYFAELSQRFTREHIESLLAENDRLSVLLAGQEIGVVIPEGAMRIRAEWIDQLEASELYHRAGSIAAEVREYMTLMDAASPLKAQSLNDPYKQLLDFNGYVLGGMESSQGVQFTSWQWTYNKTGLTLGHYCGNDYVAAKKDFALRAGLVPEEKRFTPEQLVEIYRCCADTLSHDYELTYEQEKQLDAIQTQITEMVPDFAERMKTALEQNASQQGQQTM